MRKRFLFGFLMIVAVSVLAGGCAPQEQAITKVAPAVGDLRKIGEDYLKTGGRPDHLFTIKPGRAAFVVIDMQRFACSPTDGRPFPEIGAVMRNINRLAAACRKRGIPVIWVRQNITLDGERHDAGLYGRFHRFTALRDIANFGEKTRIADGLSYDANRDHEVFKNRYSAFLSRPPELDNLLKRLGRDQLIIGGVAANVCVESTVRDAMQLDYEVTLVSDATASFDALLLEATLTNIRLFFGDVRSTAEVVSGIGK